MTRNVNKAGLYYDDNCTELLRSWDDLLSAGLVQVKDGVLSGTATVDSSLDGVLVLPDGIRAIANYAFTSDPKLRGLVGAVESIGAFSFSRCAQLRFIDVECNRIERDAFTKCARLESVENSADCPSVASTAFWWCTSLRKVNFKSGAGIESGAFRGCPEGVFV